MNERAQTNAAAYPTRHQRTQPQTADEIKRIYEKLDIIPRIAPPAFTFTNTPACTIGTSRVNEEDKAKSQVGGIRQAIEEDWQSVAVVKDARNRPASRSSAEMRRRCTSARRRRRRRLLRGARVLRNQLYPVKIDREMEALAPTSVSGGRDRCSAVSAGKRAIGHSRARRSRYAAGVRSNDTRIVATVLHLVVVSC